MGRNLIVAGLAGALLCAGTPVAAQDATAGGGPVRSVELRSGAEREIAAAPGETVELLFADGTIVTLAAGSRARVRRFRWEGGAGALELDLVAGLARIATGRIDSTNGLLLRAGPGEVKLAGAIAFIDMRGGEPVVALLAGRGAEVSVGGQVRRIERPGFAVVLGGTAPGAVRRFPAAALRGAIEALNPGLVGGAGGSSGQAEEAGGEETARDVRGGFQLASVGAGLGRGGSGTLASTGYDLSLNAEPIFDPDQPTINNVALTRGPAVQTLAQSVTQSPARGRACVDAGSPVACSQSRVDNVFRVLPDSNQTSLLSVGEFVRVRGATSSTILLKASGATRDDLIDRETLQFRGTRTRLVRSIPEQAIYAFVTERRQNVDGNFFTFPVIAIFDPQDNGIDDVRLGSQQGPNFPLGFNQDRSEGSFRLPINLLSHNSELWTASSRSDGQVFSSPILDESVPGSDARDTNPSITVGTPFGNGTVSLVQAGFREYSGTRTSVADDFNNFPARLVDRLRANFVALQIDELTEGTDRSRCAATACPGLSYFFAAGDVEDRPAPDRFSVDQFYLTPGLTGYGRSNGPAPVRALFGGDVIGALGREDAVAYVLTPATGDTARFAHADFAYRLDAGRITGLTIGAALGDLRYTDRYKDDPNSALNGNPDLEGNKQEAGRRQLIATLGRALGASDGNGANGAVYRADLTVTASGGGNPNLRQVGPDDRATAAQAQGRAGYIVLDARPPGDETSLLRLAQGLSTQGAAELDRGGGTFNGFLAGVAQLGSTGQVSWLDSGASDGFSLRIEGGTVTATLAPRTLAETPLGTLTLGGAENGAFISRDRFVALAPAGDAALVSSDFLGPFGGAGDPLAAFDAAVPEYARWGAFLGDLVAAAPSAQVASFAPWVAGARVQGAALPASGVARYSGAVLGNVAATSAAATQTYTAGGAFTHNWSFAQRRGGFAMRFDGRDYVGLTAAPTGSDFAGQLRRRDGGAQLGGVTGAFVSPAPAAGPPPGMMGRFSVNEPGYVAGGVFAGKVN